MKDTTWTTKRNLEGQSGTEGKEQARGRKLNISETHKGGEAITQ